MLACPALLHSPPQQQVMASGFSKLNFNLGSPGDEQLSPGAEGGCSGGTRSPLSEQHGHHALAAALRLPDPCMPLAGALAAGSFKSQLSPRNKDECASPSQLQHQPHSAAHSSGSGSPGGSWLLPAYSGTPSKEQPPWCSGGAGLPAPLASDMQTPLASLRQQARQEEQAQRQPASPSDVAVAKLDLRRAALLRSLLARTEEHMSAAGSGGASVAQGQGEEEGMQLDDDDDDDGEGGSPSNKAAPAPATAGSSGGKVGRRAAAAAAAAAIAAPPAPPPSPPSSPGTHCPASPIQMAAAGAGRGGSCDCDMEEPQPLASAHNSPGQCGEQGSQLSISPWRLPCGVLRQRLQQGVLASPRPSGSNSSSTDQGSSQAMHEEDTCSSALTNSSASEGEGAGGGSMGAQAAIAQQLGARRPTRARTRPIGALSAAGVDAAPAVMQASAAASHHTRAAGAGPPGLPPAGAAAPLPKLPPAMVAAVHAKALAGASLIRACAALCMLLGSCAGLCFIPRYPPIRPVHNSCWRRDEPGV